MHTMVFGATERDGRALDGLMRSVEPGDVDEIRADDGRIVVVFRK